MVVIQNTVYISVFYQIQCLPKITKNVRKNIQVFPTKKLVKPAFKFECE